MLTPPPAANLVLETFEVGEYTRDIMARAVVVRVDAAETKDAIPAFEDFGRIEDGRAVSTNIVNEMRENVQFLLNDNPARVYGGPDIENICNEYRKIGLVNIERISKGNVQKQRRTKYSSILRIL